MTESIRGERLHWDWRVALTIWPADESASFHGRNECPGTHCSLIAKEEREDRSAREIEAKGKTEERTRR